jgi:hypothetical protein
MLSILINVKVQWKFRSDFQFYIDVSTSIQSILPHSLKIISAFDAWFHFYWYEYGQLRSD